MECFDAKTNTCPIAPVCKLKGVLKQALESFFAVLDGYTLADLARGTKGSSLVRITVPGLVSVAKSSRPRRTMR